jgi:hypothetical protein
VCALTVLPHRRTHVLVQLPQSAGVGRDCPTFVDSLGSTYHAYTDRRIWAQAIEYMHNPPQISPRNVGNTRTCATMQMHAVSSQSGTAVLGHPQLGCSCLGGGTPSKQHLSAVNQSDVSCRGRISGTLRATPAWRSLRCCRNATVHWSGLGGRERQGEMTAHLGRQKRLSIEAKRLKDCGWRAPL